ncbi:MAG: radical SAM protein [Zoogloeaceae bacterium]|jgi:wyosine [tRNA(Phe)-imidazoG37] synthetase (radical SAM superfamily)|nr:radical SAM protein [Zoogloeaceae bacterium]
MVSIIAALAMPIFSGRLSVDDHSRACAGMMYVYPVVSRRAGGVSVGINLNPNNACNWRCIYCQVVDLKRGGPPPIDLPRLANELDEMLDAILVGDFMARRVPEEARRLIDIAFSGNGEPTSAAEFPQAVAIAAQALANRQLTASVKLRLITNGSLLDRRNAQAGIAALGEAGGEVWFKIDAATEAGIARTNSSRVKPASVARRLRTCAGLCATWAQTCLFALDGKLPDEAELAALIDFLANHRDCLRGVYLYGLARPSAQPEAGRLTSAPADWLNGVADRLRQKGLTVIVSP